MKGFGRGKVAGWPLRAGSGVGAIIGHGYRAAWILATLEIYIRKAEIPKFQPGSVVAVTSAKKRSRFLLISAFS